MIRTSLHLCVACAALAASAMPAQADTLMDALAAAYETNPTLAAQRAQLRATDEDLAQARALILPEVTANASVSRQHSESSGTFPFGDGSGPPVTFSNTSESEPKSVSVSASQPIWRGGLFGGARDQVRANIGREEEVLRSVEQSVLLDAVTAYMDVLRAGRVVEIRINNVDVLIDQRRAAGDRFELGEVTRTDVAQAESRLALARAELTTAQAQVQQARAAFERIVGFPPATLEPPPPTPEFPETLADAISAALAYNPQLGAAAFAEESARESIRVARSDLLPDITLDGTLSRREDSSFPGDRTDSYTVTAGVRVPLFSGGLQQSEVRQARHLAERARHELAQTRRETVEQVTAAWSNWLAADAVVASAQSAVDASDLAFEGVDREAGVGLRTTLDVLDAEQEALTARVTLATAERDAYVAAHQLLAAMGLLNVEYLGVPVTPYDPGAYQDRLNGNLLNTLFGTSID